MQAIPDALVPILTSEFPQVPTGRSDPYAPVLDEFVAGLAISYRYPLPLDSPPVRWADLTDPDSPLANLTGRAVRRIATDNLVDLAATASLHGGPPAVMVSCHGIESSLLLADDFWTEVPGMAARLGVDLPGDLVVGVPARDVLVVTGSDSVAGLAKARRCVSRVFFAADQALLSRELLVRRDGRWAVFGAAAPPQRSAERWSPPEDRVFRPRRWQAQAPQPTGW